MTPALRPGYAVWIFAVVAVVAVPARGQHLDSRADNYGSGDVEDWSLDALLGIVTAASGHEERALTAPATVSVITREDIRLSGARAIPDLLRRVAGVQISQWAAAAYSVSLRGMGGVQNNNTVVLIDGIPINSAIDGSVDWAALSIHIADIERIEVVRGPVSTVYGADAYAGVIAIATVSPRQAARAAGGLSSGIDSAGKIANSATAAVSGGDPVVAWRIAAHAVMDATHQLDNLADGGSRTKVGGLARLAWELDDWTLDMGVHGGRGMHPLQDHLITKPVQLAHSRAQAHTALRFVDRAGAISEIGLWARAHWSALDGLDVAEGAFSKDGANAIGFRTGAEMVWRIAGAQLRTGVEAGTERIDAPFLYVGDRGRWRGEYAAFATGKWQASERLRLSGGLRGDLSAIAGAQVSYRAALTFTDGQRYNARVAVGSGFRSPTYIEAIGRFTDPLLGVIVLDGSPSLKPQGTTAIEIGLTLAPSAKLMLQQVVYAAKLENIIFEDFAPLVRKTFANAATAGGFATVLGTEVEIRYHWLDTAVPRLALSALLWPEDGYANTSATVGVPAHNSQLTAAAGITGVAREGTLAYGSLIHIATARIYALRLGIPPVPIEHRVPTHVYVETSVEHLSWPQIGLWTWIKGISHLPHGVVDAPFPTAAPLGTTVFAGVEYRAQ